MAAESAATDPSDSAGSSSGPSAKLFLGGLSWETDEVKLRSYFSKFGHVEDVVVMRDKINRNPRGFGFVTFLNEDAAAAACRESHCIDGRTIDAKPSVPQGEGSRPRSKKVFVGGLAPDTSDEEFRDYFTRYGAVAEATIMVDHTSNRSRGFGFVTFEDEASVQEVFKTGALHTVSGKQVEVKSATPKGSGPVASQTGGPRGMPVLGRTGYAGGAGRGATGMTGASMGRGYESYGQQGYGGMPAYGVNMPGQYGQFGYGMPYGAYPPGMMMGYAGYGAFPQYPGQYPAPQAQPPLPGPQPQDGRRPTHYAGGGVRKPQQIPMMQMQALTIQGQGHA